jgi:hypothetical protein
MPYPKGMARQARDPGDELVNVSVRMPHSIVKKLDEEAHRMGVTRSRLLVEILKYRSKAQGS